MTTTTATASTISADRLRDRLRAVEDPVLGADVVSLGLVRNVCVESDESDVAIVSLAFNAPLSPAEWAMCDEVRALCRGAGLEPRLYAASRAGSDGFRGVKNAIGIVGAEPGVGASLVTANLAAGLASAGARVGVLDLGGAPRGTWLDAVDPPTLSADRIVPRLARGVSVVRLGPVVPTSESVLAGETVLELLLPTVADALEWGPLDYLFATLPRGPGRRPRTTVDRLPFDGTVLVSSIETDPSRVRSATEELSRLDPTVIGRLETVDPRDATANDTATGRRRSVDLGRPELELGTVPLDRCTATRAGTLDEGTGPLRFRRGRIDASDPDPFRRLVGAVTDRIGAANRRAVAARALA